MSLVLSGSQLSLGINDDGSLIDNDGPSGVGAVFNGVEFLKPGTPLEGFTVAADGLNYTNQAPASFIPSAIPVSLSDTSAGPVHSALIAGAVTPTLQLQRTISFLESSSVAIFTITLTNTGSTPITHVAFLENADPDQGIPNTFGTSNDVVLSGNFVRATSPSDGSNPGYTMGLGSYEPGRVVSAQGFDNTNPFDIINSPADPNGAINDIAINLAFDFGTLAPGASATGRYFMVFAPTAADADRLATDVTAPTITATADKTTLWPPNGKLVPVTVTGKITDDLSGIDPNTARFHVVDAYGQVQPSGPIILQADGTYSFTTLLEASRKGQDKDGRLYQIVISAADYAGNVGTKTVNVIVPHDQSR